MNSCKANTDRKDDWKDKKDDIYGREQEDSEDGARGTKQQRALQDPEQNGRSKEHPNHGAELQNEKAIRNTNERKCNWDHCTADTLHRSDRSKFQHRPAPHLLHDGLRVTDAPAVSRARDCGLAHVAAPRTHPASHWPNHPRTCSETLVPNPSPCLMPLLANFRPCPVCNGNRNTRK